MNQNKLTLKPGPFKTKADMKLIEKVEQIIAHVSNLNPGEKVLVTDMDFFKYWEYNYNPDKGETAKGELKKWSEQLYKDRLISALYWVGPGEERIEFKNELTTQLDAFLFLKRKFHEDYGFAEQPFAFLTSINDGHYLRMQILSLERKQEDFLVNGIRIIESRGIKDGEYCFVRK